MRRFKVRKEDSGTRADRVVSKHFPRFTRSSLERLFDNKLIKANGKFAKPGQKLRTSDEVEVDDSLLKTKTTALDLPIVFEDENILVINKPEGVLTHSKGAVNTEATVASFIKPKLYGDMPDTNRAGIVHRLDRATSGLIITAKNLETMKLLQKQFATRKTKKNYIAIVSGKPAEDSALIDVPIERNPRKPNIFRPGHGGKPAQTFYKVVKTINKNGKQYSLVELSPLTGRTHQLRVHLRYIDCPIVGDVFYEGEPADHLYLHSSKLEITIPKSNRVIFEAELPKYFSEFLDDK